jgi:hypothetical protein
VGATGLAAVGVGLGFGAKSLAAASRSGDHCDAEDYCDDAGLALRLDAIDARTTGFAVGIPGAVLAGVGVALLATAPSAAGQAPPATGVALEAGFGRMFLSGRW